jgi:hypothetical protein
VLLNAQALYLVSQLKSLAGSSSAAKDWVDTTDRLTRTWRRAATAQLISDAAQSRAPLTQGVPPGPYSDYHTLAWMR